MSIYVILIIQGSFPKYLFPQHQVHWTKPPRDFYKANFDAALFDSSNMAGIGVVIRDYNGNVIGALSQKIALP